MERELADEQCPKCIWGNSINEGKLIVCFFPKCIYPKKLERVVEHE